MNILSSFMNNIVLSTVELIYLVGLLVLIGFVLGFLEGFSNRFLARAFGPRGVLLTAWIGTPIHELGHLIQCFIWGHRVSRVKFLQLNSLDGVLGYVEHQYNPNSIYQQIGNFFIGLGPIFSGIGSLILGMYLFVPQSFEVFKMEIARQATFGKMDMNVIKTVGITIIAITKSLFTFHNIMNPAFWVFLLISISISSHIALSKADMESSARGLIMIFFLLILLNIAAGFLHINMYGIISKLSEYNAYVLAFSSVALLFSVLTLLFSYLLYKIKRI